MVEKIKLLIDEDTKEKIMKYNDEDTIISKNGNFHTDNLEFIDIENVTFTTDEDDYQNYEGEKYEIRHYHEADIDDLRTTYYANSSMSVDEIYDKNDKVLFLSVEIIQGV